MVSGIVHFKDCILVDNEARLGPAIFNAVTLSLESTDVCDNQLLCDDDSFLAWNNVGRFKFQQAEGGGVMLVLVPMPNGSPRGMPPVPVGTALEDKPCRESLYFGQTALHKTCVPWRGTPIRS